MEYTVRELFASGNLRLSVLSYRSRSAGQAFLLVTMKKGVLKIYFEHATDTEIRYLHPINLSNLVILKTATSSVIPSRYNIL